MNPRHPLIPVLFLLLASAGEAYACDASKCLVPKTKERGDWEKGNTYVEECVVDPNCTMSNAGVGAAVAAGKVVKTTQETLNRDAHANPSNPHPPAQTGQISGTVTDPMSNMAGMHGNTASAGGKLLNAAGNGAIVNGATNLNPKDAAGNGGDFSTQDGLSNEQLIEQVMKTAREKAAEDDYKPYASVIMATAQGVVKAIKNDPSKKGANQASVFGPMLDIEMKEETAKTKLNERRRLGQLKPGQYEAETKAIEDAMSAGMNGIPGGVVMSSFHTDFDKNWQENLKANPNPDAPTTALPAGPHIGKMIDADPKNAGNWALSGMDKLAHGDRSGAMSDLNHAIDLGGTADAFGLRGGLRAEANDFEGAYRDAVKGLEKAPGDKALMGLLKSVEGRVSPELRAQLGFGGGSSAGAGGSQASARGASAGGSPGFGGYGGGFATGGFGAGTAKLVEGMTSSSALASKAKLDEARRAWSLGDVLSAIAAAERALELNPANAEAHAFLAGVYASRGDYRKSLASASAGLAISPRDGQLLNSKAFAQNRLKQYRDALESSNSAIESDSRNPYSFANRAHAYGGLGDRDAMLADLNRAAGLDERFKKTAAQMSGQLQLPSNADVLFLFPGEDPSENAAPAAAPRKSFGAVLFAAGIGGVLLALGLLSTVLAPLKDSVVSAFTKATRRGPSLKPLEAAASYAAEPASSVDTGLIKGQYEISRQIGAGGMGMVYEGTDRSLGRRVAIKKMRDELRVNARERDRFVIEAKTVASLHHPNIVDIYAIAEEGDDVYLVFEYVDGKTIHDLVQVDGRLQMADAVQVTRAIGDALAYAHAHGVIHRDMKPSNVMLTSDGRVKVMDFGIARMAKDALTRYSMTNTVVGTPPYMAPEQEQGVVRKESDVYSLAICAYEMLTGKLPFIGMGAGMLMNKINMSYIPPSRNIAGLPASIDEVFLKAFQADPENRYRTPQEFCAALEAAAGGARNSPKTV